MTYASCCPSWSRASPPAAAAATRRFVSYASCERATLSVTATHPGVTVPHGWTARVSVGIWSVVAIRVIIRPRRDCASDDSTGNDSANHSSGTPTPAARQASALLEVAIAAAPMLAAATRAVKSFRIVSTSIHDGFCRPTQDEGTLHID